MGLLPLFPKLRPHLDCKDAAVSKQILQPLGRLKAPMAQLTMEGKCDAKETYTAESNSTSSLYCANLFTSPLQSQQAMEIQQTIFGQPVTMYPAQNRANIFHEKVIGAKRHSAWRDPRINIKPLIRLYRRRGINVSDARSTVRASLRRLE